MMYESYIFNLIGNSSNAVVPCAYSRRDITVFAGEINVLVWNIWRQAKIMPDRVSRNWWDRKILWAIRTLPSTKENSAVKLPTLRTIPTRLGMTIGQK